MKESKRLEQELAQLEEEYKRVVTRYWASTSRSEVTQMGEQLETMRKRVGELPLLIALAEMKERKGG